MQFGGRADEAASRAMYDLARREGLNHFDTAQLYTGGASEKFLGRFVRDHRQQVFIATKAAYDKPATGQCIRDSLDTSRKRMQIDAADALYLHRFDPETPLEETFEALADLKSNGLIRHVGVSNFAAWQVMKAIAVAARFDLSIDLMQPMYNLVKRQAEVEILPMCADQGIVCAPYSPLGGGLLTGKYASGGTGRLTEDERYAARYGSDWMPGAVRGLTGIARELSVDPATLAVAWVAAHPAAVVPIISARSAAQLAPSLAAMNFTMTDALYARLAALSPAPPPATDRSEETA